jgi:hydrogenase maturation protease
MSSEADRFLQTLARPGAQEIMVAGHLLRRGSRVRLKPRPGGDTLDGALRGHIGVVEGIEEDDGQARHIAIILEDDPGLDLAAARHPSRRFFFAPDEVEPLDETEGAPSSKRALVAGIGNVFLGDDGFGVAVVRQLAERTVLRGVEVVDFGIRGMDLVFALGQPYDAAILVDAVPRGDLPGRLCVMVPDMDGDESPPMDGHRMDPLTVLRTARRLGGLPPQIFIVGCEPAIAEGDALSMSLSESVAAAVEPAVQIVLKLAGSLLAGLETEQEKEPSDANSALHRRRDLNPAARQ